MKSRRARNHLAALGVAIPLVTSVGSTVAAENLGRLFFTPQQRQDLDRRRQTNVQESAATANSFVTVNGQVSRSNGKNTVWINGVPQETTRRPSDPARVSVPAREGERSINLKIGQSFDRVRGEIKDPAEDGAVSAPPVRRAQGR